MQSCCSKPGRWLLGSLNTEDGLESGALHGRQSKLERPELNPHRPVNGLPTASIR